MLSIGIQKDITEYKPKIVGQLTLRSLVCCVSAIGVSVAVGAYFYFVLGLGYEFAMYGIIFLSIPIWAAGFWHPYGMNLEKFVPLAIKHFFGNNVIKYKSSGYLIGTSVLNNSRLKAIENERKHGSKRSKTYSMLCKRPDFEAYSPIQNYEQKLRRSIDEQQWQ